MTTELQPSAYRGAAQQQQHQQQQQQHHQDEQQCLVPQGKHYRQQIGYDSTCNDSYEDRPYCIKKNAPGYKNDSGYSESLGFESFSLPLSERDAASPPPTPPVRDASSLKSVCYGPGHEKYPSWPSAPDRLCYQSNGCDQDEQLAQSGSHRSKSWTDHTNYPKEKPAQYTRPHTKRPNSTFTQQLKTVMERCEKIPAETYERVSEAPIPAQRTWPSVDREGKTLGDAEYMVPSPPERESLQTKTLSPADLEAYVRSYQDPQVTQVSLYSETDLAEPGMDEYTTVQHSQQASYAQSEGYHSYVSSVDSTTTTPFLDRLRRDSEAVSQRPMPSWEDGSSREGRDSVVTTSSGSASSSETLKWHGSMSDVSVSSGMPTSRSSNLTHPERWHHGSLSDLSSINGGAPSTKTDDQTSWPGPGNWEHPMSKSFHSVADSRMSEQQDWEQSMHSSMSDVRQENGTGPATGSKQLIAHSSRVQTPQRHHSESVLYLDRERSQRKLYPVSTTKVNEGQNTTKHPMSSSPPHANPSVAERVSELEKQQMRYTYLDPDKRHRVSDPTLKAIQKKALLSFYERHQASWRSEPQLNPNQPQQPQSQSPPHLQSQSPPQQHSPPPQPPPRPRPVSSRRASSASDYAAARREKAANGMAGNKIAGQQQSNAELNGSGNGDGTAIDPSSPKHQHSNSCGSLSTDLIGPVIVGPAISIDDWVPERPPKKPHLRTAYSDRLPSPDLPPPSPPNVTEVEVIHFDDPLPPPPPELSHDRNSAIRRSTRVKKSSPTISPTNSPPKSKSNSPNEEHKVLPGYHADLKQPLENGFGVRASLRYSDAQKQAMNEKLAAVRKSSVDERPYGLADLVAQKYVDSGNQRPAPQVPVVNNVCRESQVEPKIKRQESLKRDEQKQAYRQKPGPQVAKSSPIINTVGPSTTSPISRSEAVKRNNLAKYQPRNYQALPPKYTEAPPPLSPGDSPPPLAPRISSTKKLSPPPRPAPPMHNVLQGSQSKASYLAYRRERGAPDSEGSYKRTMSPNARLDEPVLLKVTQHHQLPLLNNTTTNNINNNNNNANTTNNGQYTQRQQQGRHELTKSQSSDSLLNKKSDVTENGKSQRLSPQSVEVLNDRNRQLERERRKLAASCEQQTKLVEDFYRESAVTTIEMTSQNVELLNRRNEKQRLATVPNSDNRSPSSSPPNSLESPTTVQSSNASTTTSTTSSSTTTSSNEFKCERKVSSPTQTDPSWTTRKLTSNNSNSSSPISPKSPRISPQPGVIEGLTLLQRTEVVLRVNAPTNDVASQTEEISLDDKQEDKDDRKKESLAKGRRKTREEIECEKLSRDLAERLEPNDKLLPILVPVPEHKKSTDYVVDLFRVEAAPQPRPRPKLVIEESASIDGVENEISADDDKKIESIPTTPLTPSSTDSKNNSLSPNSTYFTTSESKAKFLARLSQDQLSECQSNSESTSISKSDNLDLRQKKEELMVRLDKKLVVLRAEQDAVREEEELNEALGARVSSRVTALARSAEASKYKLHVEEVGKITSLLLGLSGRLARAENALYGMSADHPERKILEAKRDKLIDQLEEAKILKGNIDRRSLNVSAILAKYLNDEEFTDYQHFINMKAKLIVDAREIQDKVKLGEEQLAALKEAIDL